LPLVVLIAFAASLCCASSIGEFASRLPSAGSLYIYNSRGLRRTGGFLTSWMMIAAYALYTPAGIVLSTVTPVDQGNRPRSHAAESDAAVRLVPALHHGHRRDPPVRVEPVPAAPSTWSALRAFCCGATPQRATPRWPRELPEAGAIHPSEGEDAPGPLAQYRAQAALLAMAMFVLVVDTSLMNVSIQAVVHDMGTTVSGV
jgi:amino acid transporter